MIGGDGLSPRNRPGASPGKSPTKNLATLKIFIDAIFPSVYKLLDDYMAARGKNMP